MFRNKGVRGKLNRTAAGDERPPSLTWGGGEWGGKKTGCSEKGGKIIIRVFEKPYGKTPDWVPRSWSQKVGGKGVFL